MFTFISSISPQEQYSFIFPPKIGFTIPEETTHYKLDLRPNPQQSSSLLLSSSQLVEHNFNKNSLSKFSFTELLLQEKWSSVKIW